MSFKAKPRQRGHSIVDLGGSCFGIRFGISQT